MTFSKLNSDVLALRNVLQTYVGPGALEEVRLSHPARNNDEASFLRLTNWSYALLFEAGRVTIPFLLKLPSRETGFDYKGLRGDMECVRSLRTLSSHNLGFTDHDLGVSRNARDWHRQKCGTDSPKSNKEWRACFNALCLEVGQIVSYCHGAVDNVLASTNDGADTIADLKRRLDRNWATYRFDGIVSEICVRLDKQLNIPEFRKFHLSKWREYLDGLPEDDDIEFNLNRIIERDILNHFDDILPIDSRDVMELPEISSSIPVDRVMYRAREIMRAGTEGRDQLLEILRRDKLLFPDT